MNGPDDGPIPFAGPEESAGALASALAVATDETLRAIGLSAETASELVAMIQQVAAADPPGFPGLSAEETTRLIVQKLAAKILAKRQDRAD